MSLIYVANCIWVLELHMAFPSGTQQDKEPSQVFFISWMSCIFSFLKSFVFSPLPCFVFSLFLNVLHHCLSVATRLHHCLVLCYYSLLLPNAIATLHHCLMLLLLLFVLLLRISPILALCRCSSWNMDLLWDLIFSSNKQGKPFSSFHFFHFFSIFLIVIY